MATVSRKDRTITLVEAARRLRVPYSVVYRLVLLGEFGSRRLGGRWVVRQADVDRWARRQARS
jgi:excisionase family DNA binding protein